jgi:hypothetical protein
MEVSVTNHSYNRYEIVYPQKSIKGPTILVFTRCQVFLRTYLVRTWKYRPPLWSSGQSSWLQIQRLRFDSRHYHKKVVGLERGALSPVSTTEELLDRKVAASV